MRKEYKIICICTCLLVIFCVVLFFVVSNKSKKDTLKKVNISSGEIEQTKDFKLYEFGIEDNEICTNMDDIVAEVVSEYADVIDFEYVDVTKNIALSNNYSISAVPTFLIVDKNGAVKYRISGVMTKEELIEFIAKVY